MATTTQFSTLDHSETNKPNSCHQSRRVKCIIGWSAGIAVAVIIVIVVPCAVLLTKKSSEISDEAPIKADAQKNIATTSSPAQQTTSTSQITGQVTKSTTTSTTTYSPEVYQLGARVKTDMNWAADPCTDFFEYSCGGYLQKHSNIKSSVTPTLTMEYNVNDQIRKLLKDDSNAGGRVTKVTQKMKAWFESCIQSKRGSTYDNGLKLIRQMVADLGNFSSSNALISPEPIPLTDMLIKLHSKYTLNAVFTPVVGPNPYNVSQNVIQLTQPVSVFKANIQYAKRRRRRDIDINDFLGLLLGEFLSGDYIKLINRTSPSQGNLITSSDISSYRNIKDSINRMQQTDKGQENFIKAVDFGWLKQQFPAIELDRYFAAMFAAANVTYKLDNSTPIILQGADYIIRFASMLNNSLNDSTFRRNLHNYLVFQAVLKFRDDFLLEYSTKAIKNVKNKLSDDVDGAVTTCIETLKSSYDIPVGAMYLDKNFAVLNRTRQKIMPMVENLRQTYRDVLTQSTWLDPTTKAAALEKLNAMAFQIAFENWMLNDTLVSKMFLDFEISTDYATNLLAFYRFSLVTSNFQVINSPPDDFETIDGPADVSAFNHLTRNSLSVMAAFLTDPIYQSSPDAPDALNYGSLGSVIGHEITHAFDTNGRKLDKLGNRRNWWNNNATLTAFVQRTSCFVDQFSQYSTHGFQLNATKTLAENIGDSTGMIVAYKAFQKAMSSSLFSNTTLPGVDLNQQQLFFVGYAQWLCIAYASDSTVLSIIRQDVHAPQEWRVRGTVLNSEAFADAFSCPKNRNACVLW